MRFDPIADLKGTTLANWAGKTLNEDAHLVTDGLASFASARRLWQSTSRSSSARAIQELLGPRLDLASCLPESR